MTSLIDESNELFQQLRQGWCDGLGSMYLRLFLILTGGKNRYLLDIVASIDLINSIWVEFKSFKCQVR